MDNAALKSFLQDKLLEQVCALQSKGLNQDEVVEDISRPEMVRAFELQSQFKVIK